MRPRKGEGGIRNYGLLALPGGVQSLTLENCLPKFAGSGWRHIKFLMNLDEPARSVAVEAYYATVQQGRSTFDAIR